VIEARPSWERSVVLVCRECEHRVARRLKGALKDELRARGYGKAVRVVETSCLDVCPSRGATVAVANGLRPGSVRCFVATGPVDLGAIVAAVEERLPS
jgi:hypothetical protein